MDNVVMGRKPVLELVQREPAIVEQVLIRQGLQGQDIKELTNLCRDAGIRFRFLPAEALERTVPDCRQGVAAFIFGQSFVPLESLLESARHAPLPVVLALDQVQDPGNVGTLARTLLALGGGGLIVPKHHGSRLGGSASKASAGALERIPVHQCVNLSRDLEECAQEGYTIYKAEAGPEGKDVFTAQVRFPLVLVLGGEEKGVRPGVAKHCDESLFIPMPGEFDSLNVAQAGAVILGQMARQAFAGK
ncbi:TrmH family RNA methyltransferase [Fundidesulfovibrio soli]|uniref:TrmH family RNA methyltransferase n=1 Tax=Fundidesulfovibrio soli TaxID=2922716 RepID=UPI001FAE82C8|nr:RNA methyltransferase [Fundidesulfovibrio soli]